MGAAQLLIELHRRRAGFAACSSMSLLSSSNSAAVAVPVRERIAVLEKFVTDSHQSSSLIHEIEKLREKG
jgi:hypothetical protein